MASTINFKVLNETELQKALGNLKTFKDIHPKTSLTSSTILKSKLKDWQSSLKPVDEPVKLNKINAVRLRSTDVASIRAINESTTPTAEAVVNQKMDPDKLINTLFTSLSTLEYTKMQSEFKKRLSAASSPIAKAKVIAQWKNVVKGAQQAFASAGLKNVSESDLQKFSDELLKSKANFNTIVKIANSGVVAAPSETISAGTVLKAGFVPVTGVLIDPHVETSFIAGLCSVPLKQGSFTKHFSRSFSLTVRIPYWCPSLFDPFRICHKNVTIAGASFSVDVSVGYRVTCCGATAWGRASAEACVTVIGFRFCAGCTATITGVAGFGRTPSGGNCIYGLGINAQLKCTFAGITVLNLQAPFGWNITAPCPPVGFCG